MAVKIIILIFLLFTQTICFPLTVKKSTEKNSSAEPTGQNFVGKIVIEQDDAAQKETTTDGVDKGNEESSTEKQLNFHIHYIIPERETSAIAASVLSTEGKEESSTQNEGNLQTNYVIPETGTSATAAAVLSTEGLKAGMATAESERIGEISEMPAPRNGSIGPTTGSPDKVEILVIDVVEKGLNEIKPIAEISRKLVFRNGSKELTTNVRTSGDLVMRNGTFDMFMDKPNEEEVIGTDQLEKGAFDAFMGKPYEKGEIGTDVLEKGLKDKSKAIISRKIVLKDGLKEFHTRVRTSGKLVFENGNILL